jgi:hypothetical protein
MGVVSKQRGRQSWRSGRRQRLRRGVQIVMPMLFPAMGASQGVVLGSLLVIGRLFCAWVCPGGVSTTSLFHLIAYLLVVVVFLALMFAVGKRAPCHTIC